MRCLFLHRVKVDYLFISVLYLLFLPVFSLGSMTQDHTCSEWFSRTRFQTSIEFTDNGTFTAPHKHTQLRNQPVNPASANQLASFSIPKAIIRTKAVHFILNLPIGEPCILTIHFSHRSTLPENFSTLAWNNSNNVFIINYIYPNKISVELNL